MDGVQPSIPHPLHACLQHAARSAFAPALDAFVEFPDRGVRGARACFNVYVSNPNGMLGL
jgi:hypothetical protein